MINFYLSKFNDLVVIYIELVSEILLLSVGYYR